MRNRKLSTFAIILAAILFFGSSLLISSPAWARFGGGRSFGGFGGHSFSGSFGRSYSFPYRSGSGSMFGSSRSRMGGFTRHPFFQGMMGGLAGGFLGNLLFGHSGYGYPGGMMGGGGISLLDFLIIGFIIYLVIRLMRRRSGQGGFGTSTYPDGPYGQSMGPFYGNPRLERYDIREPSLQPPGSGRSDVLMGLQQIRQFDPSFHEEAFIETVEDIFFRVQAAWMNRQVDGVEPLVTGEMVDYLKEEFAAMKQQGRINRLENIAVRKVEIINVWQETGKDSVTVLYTANLLDYTVDDKTGAVVEGDHLNPVKFQEYWTFCRDIGAHQWQLSGIQQV